MRHQHPTQTPAATATLFKTGWRGIIGGGPKAAHRHITHEVQIGDVSYAYHATKGYRAIRVNRYARPA